MPLDRPSIISALGDAGCIAPAEEAEQLIRAADDGEALAALIERRTAGEPLAWLIGTIEFCGIPLDVARGTYVPRWHTEPLARRAVGALPSGGTAVDLCTGIGAVAAVLSAADPSARVLATELDERAAACARANGVDVYEGFLDDPLPRGLTAVVDVITAVVPYVPSEELHLLPRDVLAHEPRLALDGGPAGTDLLLEVVPRSSRILKPGGHLFMELGGCQDKPIGLALREQGFSDIEVMRDAEGDARAITGRRPAAPSGPIG